MAAVTNNKIGFRLRFLILICFSDQYLMASLLAALAVLLAALVAADCGDDFESVFPVNLMGTQIFQLTEHAGGSLVDCARRCCTCVPRMPRQAGSRPHRASRVVSVDHVSAVAPRSPSRSDPTCNVFSFCPANSLACGKQAAVATCATGAGTQAGNCSTGGGAIWCK